MNDIEFMIEKSTNKTTYREEAIKRLMSIGINEANAEEIITLIDIKGEFSTAVFNDFERDDNWYNELKLQPKQDNKFNYWRNICEIQAEQTAKGLLKYGYPLEQNTWLDINERLRYLQEELVDALMYIEHIKTLLNEGEK